MKTYNSIKDWVEDNRISPQESQPYQRHVVHALENGDPLVVHPSKAEALAYALQHVGMYDYHSV